MNKKKIMKWVILVAIIIIPVMYSFFYLKAFWDPYGNLKDMKIAIINLDKGNEDENLGNDLVESLKEKDVMQIEVLTDSNLNDLEEIRLKKWKETYNLESKTEQSQKRKILFQVKKMIEKNELEERKNILNTL